MNRIKGNSIYPYAELSKFLRLTGVAIVVVLFSFFLLLACSDSEQANSDKKQAAKKTEWPIFRGDASLSGVSKGTVLSDELKLIWDFLTDDAIIASPIVAGGKVYVGSTGGRLYALDEERGDSVWVFDTKDEIEAPALFLNGIVFQGTLSGDLYALDADSGTVVWNVRLDNGIYGSPNWGRNPAADGRVLLFVGCYDNQMYCLDAESGEIIWTYETDSYINGAPATDGNRLIFGGCDEVLHVANTIDGKRLNPVEVGSYIPGSAAYSNGRGYVGHYGDEVVCADISTGEIIWKYTGSEGGPFFSSPAVTDSLVLIGGRDGYLHCIDAETGNGLWKFRTRDEVDSSPVICGNKTVFGSSDGRLYLLNLSDGSQIWSFEIGASLIASPAVSSGRIYIGAEDGRVYAFGDA